MINRLFYIRHGLTDALEKGVLCGGDSDLDLNHKGREGVRILSRLLAPLLSNIDHIYSSPLKRAVQTAEIIGKAANKEVKIIEELNFYTLIPKIFNIIIIDGINNCGWIICDILYDFECILTRSISDIDQLVCKKRSRAGHTGNCITDCI